ncbi:MAG: fumarylacetoacetate hydrolase family protein [Pseudomonadota bacterium]
MWKEYIRKKEKGQFVLVYVTVRNTGDRARTFDAGNQKLIDTSGREFQADSEAVIAMGEESKSFLEEINPGNGVNGILVFDVPRGVKRERAGEHIRLFVLANDLTARALVSAELTKGNGLFHAKTALAFAPVAVTPDELGAAWDGRRVHLPLEVQLNDEPLGLPHAGTDMAFDFPALIAAAARMRDLRAGTIIGSGAVSNRDASVGACSLAEKRALQEEALDAPLLRIGDRIRIEMRAADGQSIFGAIAQTVVHPDRRDPQEGASSGASSDTAPADQAA